MTDEKKEYIVSARKYRPATFRSVVGQGHITTTLQSSILKGQLAHAYLFTGPRGVGKTTCARIFAKSINCMNPTSQAEACGVCESCVAFDQGRSWGIHELDAASNNSVEDIRALIEKVRIAPQVGKYSVYIIDEVHMLSAAAFNAFLKTLEEPPHYAVFILATTEKHKILPTILSRCQSYDFRRIGVKDIVDYLQYVAGAEGISYDDESLNIIAQKADGGMRDALSTFDRVVSFSGGNLTLEKTAESVGALDFNSYFSAIEMSQNEDYTSLLLLYDSTLRSGFDGQLFVSGLSEHLRNLMVAKNPATQPLLDVTGSLKERFVSQASTLEVGWIMNAMNLTNQTDASYRTATNRRLHVELALMKLCGLKKKDSQLSIAESVSLPSVSIGASVGKVAPATATATASASAIATTTATAPTAAPQTGTIQNETVSLVAAVEQQTSNAIEAPTQTPQTVSSSPVAPTQASSPLSTTQTATTNTSPKRQRVSITGLSINAQQADNNSDTNNNTPSLTNSQPQEQLSPQEIETHLKNGWKSVCEHWTTAGRPRLATALEENKIEGATVTVYVANETIRDQLNECKLEIETSVLNLLKVRANITVEVTEIEIEYKPVSIEQKLQYLCDKNPAIETLMRTFDLSS